PVLLLHGTLVGEEGIEAYEDYALERGFAVDNHTHEGVRDGHPIEESAEQVSREVNFARLEIARKNLSQLMGCDRDGLKDFFKLDGNLYQSHDDSAEVVLDLLPTVLRRFEMLLSQPEDKLATTFSGKLERLEAELSGQFENYGAGNHDRCARMAAEVVDSIAPKAVLVGHSAGGFVGYTLALNPEKKPDDDPFTYDGGNGVGEVVVLSSPIGKGMSVPAPPGVAEMPFYLVDSAILKPVEELPVSQLMRLNPLVDLAYSGSKELARLSFNLATLASVGLTSPLTYAVRPGYEQVMANSDFFKNYVEGKPIPDGVTVLAVTSPLDRMSLEDRSQVDETQANAHNLSVDMHLDPEQVERERPTWTHVKMTEMPEAFRQQFAERLLEQPDETARLLDASNNDGVRYDTLVLLEKQLAEIPDWSEQDRFSGLKEAMQKVADERLPFQDSPSFVAYRVLRSSSLSKSTS
ncbi:MAG: hypothetical protein KC910_29140, partial [Candidatus Eremiobacteraeota bacterium]|nr:hypothetical protein [Candidatus Eremiobacteraeota bacterium]